jgi:hypothetical protein
VGESGVHTLSALLTSWDGLRRSEAGMLHARRKGVSVEALRLEARLSMGVA